MWCRLFIRPENSFYKMSSNTQKGSSSSGSCTVGVGKIVLRRNYQRHEVVLCECSKPIHSRDAGPETLGFWWLSHPFSCFCSDHSKKKLFMKTLLDHTFFKRSWHHWDELITYIDLLFSCVTSFALMCVFLKIFSVKHKYSKNLGLHNSNTVNSKFYLIRSFFETFARFLSFRVYNAWLIWTQLIWSSTNLK